LKRSLQSHDCHIGGGALTRSASTICPRSSQFPGQMVRRVMPRRWGKMYRLPTHCLFELPSAQLPPELHRPLTNCAPRFVPRQTPLIPLGGEECHSDSLLWFSLDSNSVVSGDRPKARTIERKVQARGGCHFDNAVRGLPISTILEVKTRSVVRELTSDVFFLETKRVIVNTTGWQ